MVQSFGAKTVPAFLLLIAAAAMHAQSPSQPSESDWQKCRSRVPQTIIAGCTEVIRNPGETTAGVAIAFNNRGVAYGRINRFDLAIDDFTQAIGLKSNFMGWSEEGSAAVSASVTWTSQKVANMGMLGDTETTDAPPDSALFYKNRGVAYYRTGKYAKAVADFTQAMSLRAHYLEALLDRGQAHADAGEYDAAIEDYDAAMQMKPDDPAALVDRGALYARQEKYDAAIADYNHALTLRPDYGAAFAGRCFVQAIQGHLQPALDDCTAALDISPNLAPALEARGFAELKLGDYGPARADYTAAVKINDDPEAHYGRGIAEQMLGDGDAAEADIAAAQKSDAKVADEFARWGISAMRTTPQNQAQPQPTPTSPQK